MTMNTETAVALEREKVVRRTWKPYLWTLAQKLVSSDYRLVKDILQKEAFIQPGHSYLDFGCGTGSLFPAFAGAQYLGIDIDGEAVDYARRRFGEQYFRVLDVRQVTKVARTFDGVFIMGVIHHLSDADTLQALKKVSQLISPKGHVLVIELIPALSRKNLLGRLLRALDQGRFIRESAGYALLFEELFHIEKAYTVSRFPLDYGVFLLRPRRPLEEPPAPAQPLAKV